MTTSEILQLSESTYVCPKGEEQLYHVRLEQKQFDPNTGERLSVPYVQKFNAKMFENGLRRNLIQQGYSIDILHDPKAPKKNGTTDQPENKRGRKSNNN